MQRIIWAALLAFAIVLAIGPACIKELKKLKYGQTIYELGPQSHLAKQGTATMGGVMMIAAILVSGIVLAVNSARWDFVLICLASMLLHGAIGFTDDYIKVAKKRSLGLTPWQKIIMQLVVGLGLSCWTYFNPLIGSAVVVPYANVEWDLGLFYIPLMVLMLIFMINSANLLDGLDGLCASCSTVSCGAFAILAVALTLGIGNLPRVLGADSAYYADDMMNVAMLCGAGAGACLGFLRFNTYPAKVFMGDTGSMALGGLLAGVAMVMRLQFLLIPICAAMIASSLSVMIQVTYFKLTHGKRIFRMSPLHHHFELGGMKETQIVAMYTIASVLLALLALLTL